MPTIGSETYRSSELPESATKETTISESAVPPSVIHGEDWPTIVAPVLTRLTPDSLEVPGPDSELVIQGSSFTEESIIVWNGGDEVTEFVSETELKTTVKTSTVEAELPFALPVYVRNGETKSNSLTFTFVAAPERKSRRG